MLKRVVRFFLGLSDFQVVALAAIVAISLLELTEYFQ